MFLFLIFQVVARVPGTIPGSVVAPAANREVDVLDSEGHDLGPLERYTVTRTDKEIRFTDPITKEFFSQPLSDDIKDLNFKDFGNCIGV